MPPGKGMGCQSEKCAGCKTRYEMREKHENKNMDAKNLPTLDNAELWFTACRTALEAGIADARKSSRPLDERNVMAFVVQRMGAMRHRNFHARQLRAIYGAAFNGVVMTKEALAKGF